MRVRILAAVFGAASLLTSGSAEAAEQHRQQTRKVDIGVFYQSLPLLAGQYKGFFQRAGLDVRLRQVTGSTQQFQALRDGEYDLVATAIDNVANYRFNSTGNALGQRLPVQAFLAMDNGQNLSLVGRAGIASTADLRGKVLAVDAPHSGFAYVAYGLLRKAGLEPGRDVEIRPVGGTVERFEGLLRGDFDATLLSAGFETYAAERGLPMLASVTEVADPYLAIVAAGLEPWLERNRATVRHLTSAYMAATRWAFDPENRHEAIGLLMRARPGISRQTAEKLYALQTDPRVGNVRDGVIRATAVKDVLDLRAEWNGFDTPQDTAKLAEPRSGLYTR